MNFSDRIIRDEFYECYVKRSEVDFKQRKESGSNLWEIEKFNIAFNKSQNSPVHLYKTPARDVKIGESIYNETGDYVAYRSE